MDPMPERSSVRAAIAPSRTMIFLRTLTWPPAEFYDA